MRSRTALRRAFRAPLLAALLLLALVLPGAASSLPVVRVVSPGGIVAWLVEDHSNPIVAVSVGFHGGSALDPEGKAGLAQMVSTLLNEGAGDLDSQAFQMRLVRTATELGFSAGDDDFVATMRTLSESRDAGLELLRLTLTAPRFDAEPLERVRGQFYAQLVRKANDPGSVVQSTWQATAYPGHPYGRDSLGTPQTLGAITADDLHRFVTDRFARDNLHIGVAGDITMAELGPALDRTFGSLPATAAAGDVPDVAMSGAGRVIVIDHDIPQSIMIFGHQGISFRDPDFYAALVVNHVLGAGGFESRLLDEVRVKRGLAYTIFTSLAPMRHAAMITGMAGTQNARAGETLQLIRHEWQRMREEGPTEQELADAKTYLTGVYPLSFTGTIATAKAMASAQLDGLDAGFFAGRNARVDAVTLEDARRVARRLLDPDRLLVAIVGKPEGVELTPPPAPAGADAPAAPDSQQP